MSQEGAGIQCYHLWSHCSVGICLRRGLDLFGNLFGDPFDCSLHLQQVIKFFPRPQAVLPEFPVTIPQQNTSRNRNSAPSHCLVQHQTFPGSGNSKQTMERQKKPPRSTIPKQELLHEPVAPLGSPNPSNSFRGMREVHPHGNTSRGCFEQMENGIKGEPWTHLAASA